MRLPESAHTSRPWRIHELVPDFELEDVWDFPAPGGPETFPAVIRLITAQDPGRSPSRIVRALFAIRWKVGQRLGWDKPHKEAGWNAPTLRPRLPEDLRATPAPEWTALPFSSLYLLDDEFAAETANRTVHGVMHIGLVADRPGGHLVQMAVLVKPNGRLGHAYMAAIRPFRHLLVYPPMLRELERRLKVPAGTPKPSHTER